MIEDQTTEQTAQIRRVVDFRVPLTYLIGGAVSLGWVLINMWFSVGQLVKTVDEVQATVKAGNTSATTIAGEMAILKYRITNIEDTVKRTPVFEPTSKR